jgi:hypothetical protein
VVLNARLQEALPDRMRATATSAGGLASQLFALATFALVGTGATAASYGYGYQLVSAVVAASALALLAYGWRKRVML